MNYILIVLVGMVLIFFIVDMIAKIVSPDNSLGAGIIAAGMELIVGAFPALIDNVLGLLSFQITGKQASDDVNVWSLVTGFVLLVVGILVLLFIRDRFYVLNMFALYVWTISLFRAALSAICPATSSGNTSNRWILSQPFKPNDSPYISSV